MSDHPMCLPYASSIILIAAENLGYCLLCLFLSCSPPAFDVLCYSPLNGFLPPHFSLSFLLPLCFFIYKSCSLLVSCHNYIYIGLTSYVYHIIPIHPILCLHHNTSLSKLCFSRYYSYKTRLLFASHCKLNVKFNYLPFFPNVSTFYPFF
jgi:hypothetical protein